MKEINCNIIEDLIPLYKEGLCSEDAKAAVEEHIKECENCRRLCEDTAAEEKPELPEILDEKNVFRKVNKIIKLGRIKVAFLLVLILVILGTFGYLTYGEITKANGVKSFSSIVQNIETKRIAKKLVTGDIDGFWDSILPRDYNDYNVNTQNYISDIRKQEKQNLQEVYNRTVRGRKIEYIKSHTSYGTLMVYGDEFNSASHILFSQCDIVFQDGAALSLEFYPLMGGKYTCYASEFQGNHELQELFDAIDFTNSKDFSLSGLYRTRFTKKDYSDESRFTMTSWFDSAYRERLNSAWHDYYIDGGFTMDNVVCSELRYDEEKQMLCYDFTFTAHDGKGNAVLSARIYNTAGGLIPPEKEDITVTADGCGKELKEALYNFFG